MSQFSAGVAPKLVLLLLLSVSAVSVGGSGFAQTLNSAPQQSTGSFTLSGSSSSSSSAPSNSTAPAYSSVLTVSAGSGGNVSGTPSGSSYAAGTYISVTATPNSGYLFSSWTINGTTCNDGSSSSPCTFTMPPNDVTVTANFQPIAETATFATTSITSATSTTNVTTFYSIQTSTATSTTSVASSTPNVTASSTTTSQVVGPDFSLIAFPSSVWLPPWDFAGTTSFTLTLSSLQGWTGLVQFATSAMPADVTTSNLPQSYQLSSAEMASWNVQVNIGAEAQAGSYQLVITGLSGPLVHSTVVTIFVANSGAVLVFTSKTLTNEYERLDRESTITGRDKPAST